MDTNHTEGYGERTCHECYRSCVRILWWIQEWINKSFCRKSLGGKKTYSNRRRVKIQWPRIWWTLMRNISKNVTDAVCWIRSVRPNADASEELESNSWLLGQFRDSLLLSKNNRSGGAEYKARRTAVEDLIHLHGWFDGFDNRVLVFTNFNKQRDVTGEHHGQWLMI